MPEPSAYFALSHDVYEQAAIVEAAQAFAAQLNCQIVKSATAETEIAIYVSTFSSAAQSVIDEFLNYALDLSVRRKIGRG
jgi:hypothetical protein